MESGTPELLSNMIGQSKDFVQDRGCEPSTPENYHMDYERFVSETVEQKEVSEAQNIENKLVQISGWNNEEISVSDVAEKQEPLLENVRIFSDVGKLEVESQNGITSPKHISTPVGLSSIIHGDGKLEPMQLDATNNLVHFENEDRRPSGQSRKGKAKLKGPVISSWMLRSKSQEKPKVLQPTDSVKESSANAEKKRRGRKKKQMQKNTINEFSRTRTHLRYLLHRIKYEHNLIDAYSAEGWRGQRSAT